MVLLAEFHYFLLFQIIPDKIDRMFNNQHSYNYKCQKQIENGGGADLSEILPSPPKKD